VNFDPILRRVLGCRPFFDPFLAANPDCNPLRLGSSHFGSRVCSGCRILAVSWQRSRIEIGSTPGSELDPADSGCRIWTHFRDVFRFVSIVFERLFLFPSQSFFRVSVAPLLVKTSRTRGLLLDLRISHAKPAPDDNRSQARAAVSRSRRTATPAKMSSTTNHLWATARRLMTTSTTTPSRMFPETRTDAETAHGACGDGGSPTLNLGRTARQTPKRRMSTVFLRQS